MQTGDELTAFKTLFSDLVIDWVLSDDVDSFYNFKTQRIRNLVSIAGAMLINSDCEMSGDCELDETDSISEFLFVGTILTVCILPENLNGVLMGFILPTKRSR